MRTFFERLKAIFEKKQQNIRFVLSICLIEIIKITK